MWSYGHQECSENEDRGEAETTKETEKSANRNKTPKPEWAENQAGWSKEVEGSGLGAWAEKVQFYPSCLTEENCPERLAQDRGSLVSYTHGR